jgi:SAM-dependent methyltransferase
MGRAVAMIAPPSDEELRALVALKHGDVTKAGWGVRRRARFGYFTPDDHYEALLRRLVTTEARWLDVGGGGSVFPHNSALATELSQRCQLLVGVDPSPNIQTNPFVHERAQCLIEEYASAHRFDLITLRMVAEHVTDPPRVVAKLRDLLALGGLAVIYTVNRWSPLTLLSALTPHRLHHPLKRLFWGGDEKDTFPVAYRMNTRRTLRRLFEPAGFAEALFLRLDDLATFSQIRALNWIEFAAWRGLRILGIGYPESCLLGAYQRRE